MDFHKTYGIVAQEVGWVPAPGYLLRRNRVLKLVEKLNPGQLLEIGCGAGALIFDLSQRGFRCTALETSRKAREIASYINSKNENVKFYANAGNWIECFDQIVALEVLEHIEDDHAALKSWYSWLKPGGKILVSVPAHQRKWGADDAAVGHYRRYEKDALIQMTKKNGFDIEHFENWGFPLANIIRPLRIRKYKRKLNQHGDADKSRDLYSAESGIERTVEMKVYPLQASWFGVLAMKLFFGLQGLFSRTELGEGFLLLATKK
jgi:SAM-dependent methyltransferase